jgi:hypothetical protein
MPGGGHEVLPGHLLRIWARQQRHLWPISQFLRWRTPCQQRFVADRPLSRSATHFLPLARSAPTTLMDQKRHWRILTQV